ncbi:MAG: hypothetical protein ACLU6Y_08240 [Ruminococcus sp.]
MDTDLKCKVLKLQADREVKWKDYIKNWRTTANQIFIRFHMPGHKRNKACVEGIFPLRRDITEIDGFDDLHHSVRASLLEAQNALSRLYGTKRSFFSVKWKHGRNSWLPFLHL